MLKATEVIGCVDSIQCMFGKSWSKNCIKKRKKNWIIIIIIFFFEKHMHADPFLVILFVSLFFYFRVINFTINNTIRFHFFHILFSFSLLILVLCKVIANQINVSLIYDMNLQLNMIPLLFFTARVCSTVFFWTLIIRMV